MAGKDKLSSGIIGINNCIGTSFDFDELKQEKLLT